MPISHQGCEFMTVLITSGPLSGMVFDASAFATVGSQWNPSARPPGIVEQGRPRRHLSEFPKWPTFTDWIAGWLEQGFEDLKAEERV